MCVCVERERGGWEDTERERERERRLFLSGVTAGESMKIYFSPQ